MLSRLVLAGAFSVSCQVSYSSQFPNGTRSWYYCRFHGATPVRNKGLALLLQLSVSLNTNASNFKKALFYD